MINLMQRIAFPIQFQMSKFKYQIKSKLQPSKLSVFPDSFSLEICHLAFGILINLVAHPGWRDIAPDGQTSWQQKQRMHLP
jgi:hypothetical protein